MGKFRGKPKAKPQEEEDEKPRYERRAEFSDDSEDVFSEEEDESEAEDDEEEAADDMLPAAEEDDDDDEEDDDEEEEEEDGGNLRWGNKRSDYFKRDSDSEEEGEDFDNEQEALRLKKKRQSKIKAEDLEIGSVDSDEEVDAKVVVRKGKAKSADDDETLAAEAPEILALLGEFSEKASEVRDSILPIVERLKSEAESATKEGVAYLETKVHLLLSYTINVAFFLMYRAEHGAARAEAHPVVAQLVKLRTLLEKLRPLDLKLKNELDELVRKSLVDENKSESRVPASKRGGFRPDLADLEGGEDDEDEDGIDEEENSDDDEGEEQGDDEDGEIDETELDPKERKKKEREQRRLLARASKSSFVRDMLHNEDTDAPEEVVDDLRAASRQSKYELEKRKFEEENFVRVRENKKTRARNAFEEKRKAIHGGDMNTLLADIDQSEYAKFKDLLDEDAAPLSFGRDRGDASDESDGEATTRKPAALARHLNEMAQARKSSKSQFKGGDDDVLPTKRQRVSARQPEIEQEMEEPEPRERFEVDEEAEHPFYKEAVSRRKSASKEREDSYQFPKRFAPEPVRIVEAGEARLASRQIIKNRGLTPHRRKDVKNPRRKMREKFEDKLKARRGQVRDMRTGEGDYYQGEASGIRATVVRSRQAGKI